MYKFGLWYSLVHSENRPEIGLVKTNISLVGKFRYNVNCKRKQYIFAKLMF